MKKIFLLILISLILPISAFAQAVPSDELENVQALFLSGDYNAAIREGTALMAQIPQHSQDKLYYLMALCLLKNKKFMDSREWFLSIIEQFPESSYREASYIGIADAYLLDNQPDIALGNYQHIIDIFPSSEGMCQTLYKIGFCYHKFGEWDNAAQYFSRVISLYPYSFEAQLSYRHKAEAYFTVQCGVFSRKESAWKLVRDLKQKDYPAYLIRRETDGSLFYHVMVGRFAARAAVLSMEKKLREQENLPTRIFP